MKRSRSFKTPEKASKNDYNDFQDAFKSEVKEEVLEYIEETPDNSQSESELLPGPKGQPLYYDGVGYYYNETSEEESFRLLHCSHSGCGAQAQMDLAPGAPITLLPTSEGHAHPPSIARRERIRFLHRIKTRHSSENSPFHVIFHEEAKLNPFGASFFSFEKIEKHLKKKASQTGSPSQATPQEEAILQTIGLRSAMKTRSRGPADSPAAKKKKLEDSPNTQLQCKAAGSATGLENNSPIIPEQRSHLHNYTPEKQEMKQSSKRIARKSAPGKSLLEEVERAKRIDSSSEISYNSNNGFQETEKRNSAKLSGPEFFHNFKGYFYYSVGVENGERNLRCLVPTCMAKASMSLEYNAEIRPLASSRPHNHKPDLTTDYNDKIKQMESVWLENFPSERLPSFQQQYCCYHDRRGFYYYQSSEKDNIRYLTCIEPTCSVKAHMCTQKDSPITISPLRPPHNHVEDPSLRDALLFIDAARVRVRSGIDPLVAIEQETERNLIGANRVDLKILELCLKKVCEICQGDNLNEDTVDFSSSLKPVKMIDTNTASNLARVTPTIVQNHFDTLLPVLDLPEPEAQDQKCKVIQEKEQSERVPALLSNSWLYHDGCGFYYMSRGISQDKRFLQCAVPECKVRGWMSLEPQAPIHTTQTHSHGRQPAQYCTELWFYHRIKAKMLDSWNEPVAQIYSQVAAKDPEGAALISEEDAQNLLEKLCPNRRKRAVDMINQPGKVPSERLPGPGFCNVSQYHDGQGFYYYQYKKVQNSNMWYLRCVCPTCPGKATMACEEGAPITVKYRHCHGPDLLHHQICLFTYALKKRARDEYTPLRIIYSEEATKYPDAAAVMQESKVKGELLKIRRYVKCQMGISAEGDDEDDMELYPHQLPNATSEVLQGRLKPVYHDGRGYYFVESFSTDSFRYLMCMEAQCLAQAKMLLVSGAPVVPQMGAAPHNHAHDPLRGTLLKLLDTLRLQARSQRSKPIRDIYHEAVEKEPIVAPQISKDSLIKMLDNVRKADKTENTPVPDKDNQIEEESLFVSDEPAERLPSYKHQGWLYHDGRGYYFYCHDMDKEAKRRLLKCCDCEASAWLELKPRSVITRAAGSVLHSHAPDMQRRNLLLVLHRVSNRVSSEAVPFATILEEETKRNPEIVALIAKENMKDTLEKMTVSKYFKEDIDTEEECILEESLGNIDDNEFCQKTCETLHSTTTGQPIYSDGRGFYYRDHCRTSSHKRHLVCIWPLCKTRAFIVGDEWKIVVPKEPSQHSHEPDTFYRNKLIFVHNLRQRILHEDTSINTIYNEEANREPIGADMVNDVAIKNFMYKLRKSKKCEGNINYVDLDLFEDFEESECESNAAKEMFLNHLEKNETVTDLPNSIIGSEDNADDISESAELECLPSKPKSPEKICNIKQRPVLEISGKILNILKPTEILPSRTGTTTFYNGEGYYFKLNTKTDSTLYLRCAEYDCRVRAWKLRAREDAPIFFTKDSPPHNHQPDFTKRKQLLFLHRCKLQAAAADTPLNDIWLKESAREPEIAKLMSAKNVKAQLRRYRQEKLASDSGISAQDEKNDSSNSVERSNLHGASLNDYRIQTDPNTNLADETLKRAIPERVPSLTGETLWHAGGFFYVPFSTEYMERNEIIKCKCVDKGCGSRCQITVIPGESPSFCMSLPAHNHPADPHRKDQLWFIHRCKLSATERPESSVDTIYCEEATKYPQIAKQLSASRVKQAMITTKKAHKENYEDEFDDDLESVCEISELKNHKGIPRFEVPVKYFESDELGGLIFHDDSGFFYKDIMRSKAENKRFLKCVECGVRMVTCLKPMDSCTLPADHARRHFHLPGLQMVVQTDNSVKLQKIFKVTSTKPKIETNIVQESQVKEDHYTVQDASNDENSSDPEYTDFVTLEEEHDNPDSDEAAESDPDFYPSPKNPDETKKQYHDGNGYYFTLVKDRKKRWLKCLTAKCPAKVPLEPQEKPLLKLFKVSPSHPHPPDQLRRKRNLFLKQAALKSTSVDPVSATNVSKLNSIQRARKGLAGTKSTIDRVSTPT